MPSAGTHQGLPNNPDAEANVLSAMLLSSEVVEEALTEASPLDDFYRPMNKALFETMHDMYDRSMPIDSITLIDYLNSENKLQEVGGEGLHSRAYGPNTVTRELAAPCFHCSP